MNEEEIERDGDIVCEKARRKSGVMYNITLPNLKMTQIPEITRKSKQKVKVRFEPSQLSGGDRKRQRYSVCEKARR